MDLRCFISIELPEKLKKDINALTDKLRATGADVKWVHARNLHLTLKFLGNTPEEKLPVIKDHVQAAASRSPSFIAALSGVGVFPSRKRPRVIWIGISGSDEIIDLQGDIEKNLQTMGYEPESRPFRAHLTIGRARSMRGRDLLLRELDALEKTVFGEFRIGDVSIMKSELKPSGAIYTKLYSIPLGGNN
jgi:2'-5' RNA ligase